jgi:hypothetical protein
VTLAFSNIPRPFGAGYLLRAFGTMSKK